LHFGGWRIAVARCMSLMLRLWQDFDYQVKHREETRKYVNEAFGLSTKS
jgi:hypothetical protein